jgi:hypothetical protein
MQCACGEIFRKKEDGSFDKFCMKCGQPNPFEQAKQALAEEVRKKAEKTRIAEEKSQKQENERQHREYINSLKAGDIIEFGSYPFETDGTEKPIEWIILERYSDDTALLLSRYGLNAVRFDNNSNNWKESNIRAWLNNTFYNKAFDEKERVNIIESNVECEKKVLEFFNRWGAINYTVTDKIFLLSTEEALKYFSSEEERICRSTPWASTDKTATGTPVSSSSCCWWLRSPRSGEDAAAEVDEVGCVCNRHIGWRNDAVRPALKINLNNL